mmetsp:Transcript_24705/g.43927  ORF Transcript_24705/g.43927 Transcript_24705/m.43927 type:complete len:259 (-) Transcript_24705:1692-2468(-)
MCTLCIHICMYASHNKGIETHSLNHTRQEQELLRKDSCFPISISSLFAISSLSVEKFFFFFFFFVCVYVCMFFSLYSLFLKFILLFFDLRDGPVVAQALMPEALLDGLGSGAVEPLVADELLEVRPLEHTLDAVARVCEAQLDVPLLELLCRVLEDVDGRGVDVGDRRHLQHDVLDVPRAVLRALAHEVLDRVADERHVGEVHRRAEADDQHAFDPFSAGRLLDAAVVVRALDPPDQRDLRPDGFVDDDHKGDSGRGH